MSETLVKSSVGGVGILSTTRVKIAIFVRMKPPCPLGDKNFWLLRPPWFGGWEGEIRGINSFNSSVLPSIVSQVPFKARQVP